MKKIELSNFIKRIIDLSALHEKETSEKRRIILEELMKDSISEILSKCEERENDE